MDPSLLNSTSLLTRATWCRGAAAYAQHWRSLFSIRFWLTLNRRPFHLKPPNLPIAIILSKPPAVWRESQPYGHHPHRNGMPQQQPGTSVAKYNPGIQGEVEGGSSPTPGSNGLPIGGALGTGAGLLLGGPTTDQGVYDNANNFGRWFDSTRVGQGLNWLTGSKSPTWGTPPQAGAAPPGSQPQTQTQTQSQPDTLTQGGKAPPPIDLPPFTINGGGGKLPPFVRGPIPFGAPQHTPAQRAGAPNLGYGVPQPPPQDPFAIHPSNAFTTIDRPNADISGGRSVAGQLAPQYFNRAREPGGPAQMGALDLSGLFNHPAVAQAAAAHPMVQAAARAPVQGPLSALAPQRAPMVQQQWSANTGMVGYGRDQANMGQSSDVGRRDL